MFTQVGIRNLIRLADSLLIVCLKSCVCTYMWSISFPMSKSEKKVSAALGM